MKVYELKCNNCGADLKVSEDRKVIFCEYCGSKNLVDDSIIRSEVNHSGTIVYRDEAKLRELELKEAERIREENKRKAKYHRWHIVLLVEAALAFIIGFVPMLTNRNGTIEDVMNGILTLGLGCYIVPFFYPYSYSKRNKVANYIIWFILNLILFAVLSMIGAAIGSMITGKTFA